MTTARENQLRIEKKNTFLKITSSLHLKIHKLRKELSRIDTKKKSLKKVCLLEGSVRNTKWTIPSNNE